MKIMASGPITLWQIDGAKKETVTGFIFLGFKISADGDCNHEIKRWLLLRRKTMTKLDSVLKSRDITLLTKVHTSQSYGFSSSHVWVWELDHKEGWAPKNWCFWNVVLEKTFESPLDCKEIKPVNPNGNQSWIFIGRTDADTEVLILWPSDARSWLTGKDPHAWKDWGQEKRVTGDEMVGWHHWLNGPWVWASSGSCNGQGSLVCCIPWGRKKLDATEQLNWTELNFSRVEAHGTWHMIRSRGQCWDCSSFQTNSNVLFAE